MTNFCVLELYSDSPDFEEKKRSIRTNLIANTNAHFTLMAQVNYFTSTIVYVQTPYQKNTWNNVRLKTNTGTICDQNGHHRILAVRSMSSRPVVFIECNGVARTYPLTYRRYLHIFLNPCHAEPRCTLSLQTV